MANPQLEDGFIRISTELWEALMKTNISGEAIRIFNCIVRKTYGWGKKKDNISFSQFQKETNIPRRNAIRAINKLKEMNLISVQIDTTRGNLYSINKKYLTWRASVRSDTVVSKQRRGSVNSGQKVVSKPTHTIDTNNRYYTIDKDLSKQLIKVIQVWFEYKKERRQMYKSERSAKVFIKQLQAMSNYDDGVAEKIVMTSIANNWAGIFPLKGGENNESRLEQTISAGRKFIEGDNS